MARSNTEIVSKVMDAMNAGNAEAYLAALADDVRYTVIGTTHLSGTVQGKDALISKIVVPLMEKLEGPLKVKPEAIFGEGDRVCVQAKGEAATKSGKRYDNTYCFIFRFRGDKIAEVTEYLDTDLVRSALA